MRGYWSSESASNRRVDEKSFCPEQGICHESDGK